MQIVDARIKVYVRFNRNIWDVNEVTRAESEGKMRFNRNIMGCKFMWVINRFFSCSDLIGT